jgi:hypothetical protein
MRGSRHGCTHRRGVITWYELDDLLIDHLLEAWVPFCIISNLVRLCKQIADLWIVSYVDVHRSMSEFDFVDVVVSF